MKINYTFADGTVSEVEVSEEIGAFIVDSRRLESNYDRKCRYHNYSLDAIVYEGIEYADPDTPDSVLEEKLDRQKLLDTLELLTETERRRLFMYADGLSYREIARREGVSDHKVVIASIEGARKKFRKYF